MNAEVVSFKVMLFFIKGVRESESFFIMKNVEPKGGQ